MIDFRSIALVLATILAMSTLTFAEESGEDSGSKDDYDCQAGFFEGVKGVCEKCKSFGESCVEQKECCGNKNLECDNTNNNFCVCSQGFTLDSDESECQTATSVEDYEDYVDIEDLIVPFAIWIGVVIVALVVVLLCIRQYRKRKWEKMMPASAINLSTPSTYGLSHNFAISHLSSLNAPLDKAIKPPSSNDMAHSGMNEPGINPQIDNGLPPIYSEYS